jgi:hypothetical protein
MIRGFFDEILVAERQFDDGAALPPFTPGSAPMPVHYRHLRLMKIELAKAEPTDPAHIAALDVVREAAAITCACIHCPPARTRCKCTFTHSRPPPRPFC